MLLVEKSPTKVLEPKSSASDEIIAVLFVNFIESIWPVLRSVLPHKPKELIETYLAIPCDTSGILTVVGAVTFPEYANFANLILSAKTS